MNIAGLAIDASISQENCGLSPIVIHLYGMGGNNLAANDAIFVMMQRKVA